MDWIHCNSCFIQPGQDKERHFELANCGHIYCNLCALKCANDGCGVCGCVCTLMKITTDMRPDIKTFFTEPEELVKKMVQVMQYQKNQRIRLTTHYQNMAATMVPLQQAEVLAKKIQELEKKAQEQAQQVEALKKQTLELDKKNHDLKKMVQFYESQLRPETPTTPAWSPGSTVCQSPARPAGPHSYDRRQTSNASPAWSPFQSGAPTRQQQSNVEHSRSTPPVPKIQPHKSSCGSSYSYSQQPKTGGSSYVQNLHSALQSSQSQSARNLTQTQSSFGGMQISNPTNKKSSPALANSLRTTGRLTLQSPSYAASPPVLPDSVTSPSSTSQVLSPYGRKAPGKISPFLSLHHHQPMPSPTESQRKVQQVAARYQSQSVRKF